MMIFELVIHILIILVKNNYVRVKDETPSTLLILKFQKSTNL